MSERYVSSREMGQDSLPLVSVVLPTYNRTEYLRRAVRSVTEQTYPNIELIVVDDHSPSPATETLAELSLDSLTEARCLRHEDNRGANVARNTGIEAAAGEFIALLDDDDAWLPEKIERQVAVFERAGPAVGVVYTGMRLIDENDDELQVDIPTIEGQVMTDLLSGRTPGTFSVLMVRSTFIDAAGLPNEGLPSWQDFEWCLRLAAHCEFAPVPEALMIRRTGHEGRVSGDYERKRDVSYPRLVSAYRPIAAKYGPEFERRFIASLSRMLGMAALKNGYYSDARRYLLRSLRNDPFDRECLLHFLASLGGKYTYLPARRGVRFLRSR